MKFSYETQGAITYLVCELETAEQIDSLTLGMLTNNHISGLAPVLYTEMNGQQFLKYNISAKISSEQFFSGNMNKQRTLQAFGNILETICSIDEYMIEQNCFSILPEHVFINVSNCEAALICIPVITDKNINPEISNFFKKIMFSSQFDSSEDAGYITQLITYINDNNNFNVYGLRDLVKQLQSDASMPQTLPMQQAYQTTQVQQQQIQTPPPAAPVSSYDSTISIDDMPTMMAAKKSPNMAPQAQAQPKPQVQQSPTKNSAVNIPPSPTVPPVIQSQGQVQQKPPTFPAGKPINNAVPPIKAQPNISQVPVVPKPVTQNSAGFAIPGQPMTNAPKAQAQPAPVQPKAKQPDAKKEKKMSFFGLMTSYSKENAELYKKQKEEAKKAKAAAKSAQKPVQPIAPVSAPVNSVPMGAPSITPQFAQQQYKPAVQPVPVQNSFNETTVLSPMMAGGGETTVLGATGPNPCLTRVKTGERISINKPVFRIGKEKSYVDYFIADNTAISRSHANVHTENGEYFIEDTNSTNHTYVNGVLINSNVKTKLKSGDKVKLANEDFTFSV